MDEPPADALRKKKDSSMRVAINLVKDGAAQAAVSAGNTGALMATARFVLKTLPGIDRPAIVTTLPTYPRPRARTRPRRQRRLHARTAAAVRCHGIDPGERRGGQGKAAASRLLNIGAEDIKGNEIVKQTNELLRASRLNYRGYVEGDEIYNGDVDVIVCDGFVGNVALKTSEGLARMIAQFMREEFKRNLLTQLAALVALPVLKAFRRRVDPRRYNGATLIGLNGIVIKSHGGADSLAFRQAIFEAMAEVRNDVPARIGRELAGTTTQGAVA